MKTTPKTAFNPNHLQLPQTHTLGDEGCLSNMFDHTQRNTRSSYLSASPMMRGKERVKRRKNHLLRLRRQKS